MSEFVVIRLNNDDMPVDWLIADNHGTRLSPVSSNSLQEIAALTEDRAVIALVPSTDIVCTSVKIPAKGAAKIRTALPFALEESLAEDVENLHFAIGERDGSGRIPVAIVSREKMQAWVERLRAAGIEAIRLVAENQGLAKIPGTMSMLIDGPTLMFNDGDNNEFVMQDVKPTDVLVIAGELGESSTANEAASGSHLVLFCSADSEQHFSNDVIALRHELDSVDVNILPDGALPKLAVTVASGHGINLLQGAYGKKTEYAMLFRPWRVAASLLLMLGVIAIALQAISSYQLAQDRDALRQQFTAEYQQIRPDDQREIADPVALVESLRRSLGGSSAPQVFLPSLRELGSALAANASADIEAISYRAGLIDLRVTAPDVATLDNIQKAVSASGRFTASIQSTDQIADKIIGRIQIREANR